MALTLRLTESENAQIQEIQQVYGIATASGSIKYVLSEHRILDKKYHQTIRHLEDSQRQRRELKQLVANYKRAQSALFSVE